MKWEKIHCKWNKYDVSLCLRCTLNEYNTLVWQEFKNVFNMTIDLTFSVGKIVYF